MKKRIVASILLVCIILSVLGCSKTDGDSYLKVTFIDVGQGDSALIECDGHFMLIDGGPKSAGDKVYSVLKENNATKLDFLVISHMHEDHYGGLPKALKYVQKIEKILSNTAYAEGSFISTLHRWKKRITVPKVDKEYDLGSAKVRVIENSNKDANDSLVLLIEYGENRILFTGDIQKSAQQRIVEKYADSASSLTDIPCKFDILKMPHHGAYNEYCAPDDSTLYRFLWTFMPDHVVFSVGQNSYGHPSPETLSLLNTRAWQPNIYSTLDDGDIVFISKNGKAIKQQE